MPFSLFPSSKQVLELRCGDQTIRWLLQPGEKHSILLDERHLRREIPHYADLTQRGRRKAVDRYLRGLPVILRARIDESLPNVGLRILGRPPCRDDFRAGADAFLRLLDSLRIGRPVRSWLQTALRVSDDYPASAFPNFHRLLPSGSG